MQFNVDKCHLLRFTLRHNTTEAHYHLGGTQLSSVSDYPYLGVTFSSDMSWKKHIDKSTNKANRMLGLLRRNLRNSSQKIREQAYISLVRPHVEYCSSVWSPHTNKDITRVENIQRGLQDLLSRIINATAMINELQWKSLEWRRQAASLALLYKIQYNLVAINLTDYLAPMLTNHDTRAYHPSKFKIIDCRINLYKAKTGFIFSPHHFAMELSSW